ncbi:class I SAM-dependent methyltransferase [Kineosporia mesophila]|uniref:Class I SAM-dependent methyltransferase n=1 Tax=Kineosporia mesophila TaxID=566012 RepID=A0ABP6Z8N1_9ACTN|nr:class I SAM-dependent methyltransferase [Kineosporia mesophila]MCD5352987.1 class I SAM-dependent methyltransferase [Kineosporia mesophila]
MSGLRQPRPVTPAGILAHQLQALARQADSLPEVDPALRRGLDEACRLAAGLDPYLNRWSSPASPALRSLEERTRAHDWSAPGTGDGGLEQEMLSGQVEGQLLKLLVHATRARHVLEIGMFTGYSALAMAEALPPAGRVVACELNAAVAAFAAESFARSDDGSKIEVRVGPAEQTLRDLERTGEVFDLVFLDADKAGYRSYLDLLLAGNLLAPHALICVDNTLMQGEPWTGTDLSANGAAIAGFNRAVADDDRVEQVILPLRDGLTLIRRVDPTPSS